LNSSPEKILYQKGGLLWQPCCHSNKRDEEGGCNEINPEIISELSKRGNRRIEWNIRVIDGQERGY
jgi:hypothetical protein